MTYIDNGIHCVGKREYTRDKFTATLVTGVCKYVLSKRTNSVYRCNGNGIKIRGDELHTEFPSFQKKDGVKHIKQYEILAIDEVVWTFLGVSKSCLTRSSCLCRLLLPLSLLLLRGPCCELQCVDAALLC
jgi:hypothetical protein